MMGSAMGQSVGSSVRRSGRVVRSASVVGVLLAGALVVGGVLGGCRGDRSEAPPRQFFPDLDDQIKVDAQEKSTFFQEFAPEERYAERWGRAARLPVENTVAFGRWPVTEELMGVDFAERDDQLRLNDVVYTGRDAGGEFLRDIPEEIPVDAALLALGEKKYNIYCISCHGGTGAGDGLVGVRWISPVPSYHSSQYLKESGGAQSSDGHLYDVIRNGVQNPPGVEPRYRMPRYGNKVSPEEAWAIVAYIRALQMTRRAELDMLDQSDRERLLRERRSMGLGGMPGEPAVADAGEGVGR